MTARPGPWVDRRLRALAAAAPPTPVIARWGLGLMLVAAGTHKLVAPAVWAGYVTGWLAPWLVVAPTTFMLVNGWLELGFAVLLLADRWTAVAAAVATVSLAVTTGYLAVVWVTTGAYGDVVARDVGLTGLAVAVLRDALTDRP